MDLDKEGKTPQLFLVRLWMDAATGSGVADRQDWHGKVQNVATGKAASFDSQTVMLQLLASMCAQPAETREGVSDRRATPQEGIRGDGT